MTSSLLAYLKSDVNRSNIILDPVGSKLDGENMASPFAAFDPSGPLAYHTGARMMTHCESEIKRVSLLIQRDKYIISESALFPLTNPAVEKQWQDAYLYYKSVLRGRQPIFLAEQIDETGRFVPFDSLFYCNEKEIFFHPYCMNCGEQLVLCTEDEILEQLGLPGYTTSLNRYLYCPKCFSTHKKADFYTYHLQDTDPECTKDLSELIHSFGKKTKMAAKEGKIPCESCKDRNVCFGSKDAVTNRIIPFSFYPFYMFIFNAGTLNAVDYLALVSGASIGDVIDALPVRQRHNRKRCLVDFKKRDGQLNRFFNERNDRDFFEVLYLKLSFLRDVGQIIFESSEPETFYNIGLSIDRFWVNLNEPAHLLPCLWRRHIQLIDVGDSPNQSPFLSDMYSHYRLHYFSLMWFYTFLVNQNQNISVVFDSVRQIESIIGKTRISTPMDEKVTQVFSPENVFWQPAKNRLTEVCLADWQSIQCFSWNLFMHSLSPKNRWDENRFWGMFNELVTGLKERLFNPTGNESGSVITKDMRRRFTSDLIRYINQNWPSKHSITQADVAVEPFKEKEGGEAIVDTEKVHPDKAADQDILNLKETLIVQSKKSTDASTSQTSPIAESRSPVTSTSRLRQRREDLNQTIVVKDTLSKSEGAVKGRTSTSGERKHVAKKTLPSKQKDTLDLVDRQEIVLDSPENQKKKGKPFKKVIVQKKTSLFEKLKSYGASDKKKKVTQESTLNSASLSESIMLRGDSKKDVFDSIPSSKEPYRPNGDLNATSIIQTRKKEASKSRVPLKSSAQKQAGDPKKGSHPNNGLTEETVILSNKKKKN